MTSSTWAIIPAAGRGSRMAAHTGQAKQFIEWHKIPLYWHSALTLARVARVQGLVLVFPQEDLAREEARIQALCAVQPLNIPWKAVAGGTERQDSVRLGLAALPLDAQKGFVLVHDAARPLASAALFNRVLDALHEGHPAVIPGIAVADTIKVVHSNLVSATPERQSLRAIQTPQGFAAELLIKAHAKALQEGYAATDDAALMEYCAHPVLLVPGEAANHKLTTPEDLAMLTPSSQPARTVMGLGYDVHRFTDDTEKGRPMRLGGVLIPKAPLISAHSDGDTLLHALADALLGCFAGGDIGQIFPDTSPACDTMSSSIILDEVLGRFHSAALELEHVDITVICQTPKIAPHSPEIRRNLCRLLALPPERVSLKATTEEGLGFTGQKLGIKVQALACATQKPSREKA